MMEDRVLKKLVEAELDWEPSIDPADVAMTIEKGIVTLTGHVPTYAQKTIAEAVVKRVKGARGFVDRLEVKPLGIDFDSDEALAARIASVIAWDATIPKDAIKVEVAAAHVTMIGQVHRQHQRAAAERAVRNMKGVRGVTDQVTVKPLVQASDIKHRIEAALDRQADLTADKIRIIVDGDHVRLEGSVRAWVERDAIERAAWAAPGVRAVDDRIGLSL
jgi:osmotically-inducible protein OsmY